MKHIYRFAMLVFLLFLCSSASLLAQKKVSGKVIDADTQEPLMAVTVVIKGLNSGGFTDID